jgi:triosephosphate isomerase
MTPGVRPLVAGNWKMNGLTASLSEIERMRVAVEAGQSAGCDVALCPPATLLASAAFLLKGSAIALGGQDCHVKPSGPHTGDVSAPMLKDAGASVVIVGHSERRAFHGETSAIVKAKGEAALAAGLMAIVCVGETREERRGGRARSIASLQVERSLPEGWNSANCVVAYEPVWAIGTGVIPTPIDVVEMHESIRELLIELRGDDGARARILYGGSVKPDNARELLDLANVDGALVGGASLKAADFMAIAGTYRELGVGSG